MKQNITLKNTFGLSQEEAGMLLGISRGQYSMFVSGKRNLPLDATTKLTALLQYLQEDKGHSKERKQLEKAEAEKTYLKLEQDYRNVTLKLHRVAQKIKVTEDIRNESFAALQVASFLEKQEEKHPVESLAEFIRMRATHNLNTYNLHQLTELQLKKESFELLQHSIGKKLKRLK
ncbi:helix-turn-helix domain-containing protein [Flavobacterium humi]|uniref:Helix-turn-helix domain-containing protein n=1 Tax=Flavobacterium humi TaxID=2562683 RepID=A0A4Z0L9X3_9FLAO|nr:helix-turn-helix transcriptional regulator [Flavobacterium humi]TGD58412.1 helix-turn-helix domain-containing protein [Flavobacterium humi]